MDGKYYNLWSADNTKREPNDDVVIKSVYDPSPVGYSLPASNAFTGFTITGQNTSNPTEFNVKGNFNKGWDFYCKPNKQGDTVFFQTFGWRLHNPGKQERFNIGGWLWTSGTNIKTEGRGFGFRLSAAVFPLDYDLYRSYGFAVRSAEEKVRRKILRRINFLSSQWGQHKCHRSVCMRNHPRRSVSYGKQGHSFDLCLLYWKVL